VAPVADLTFDPISKISLTLTGDQAWMLKYFSDDRGGASDVLHVCLILSSDRWITEDCVDELIGRTGDFTHNGKGILAHSDSH